MKNELHNAQQTLSRYLASDRNTFSKTAVLSASVAGAAFLVWRLLRDQKDQERTNDDAPAWAFRGRNKTADGAITGNTVLINRPPEAVYAFWKDFTNLPKFMENIQSVTVNGPLSEWQIAAPGGTSVKFESRLTDDKANERLAWATTENAQVRSEGKVTFTQAPGNRGTLVQVEIHYEPPGGELGKAVAHLFRKAPGVQARHDLKRLKMLLETGEIATSQRETA